MDEWLNEETPPPPVKVQDNYAAYYQKQGGRGLDARGHQEQHNYQREEYHSQTTSASAVVQSDNTNFNGLFAGNDDDVAFFDTLGGAEETMAAPPPPLVYRRRVESKGVDSISATNAPAVDDDFLNDFADVSNPPIQLYQQPTAAATIPPPPVTQPAVRAYEPPSEFGGRPPKMFTPPPPPPSISSLPVVQQQNSHAVAYEPPSDFGVPPLVPAQAAVGDFGVPPLVPAQAAVVSERFWSTSSRSSSSGCGVRTILEYLFSSQLKRPSSDFGVPPPRPSSSGCGVRTSERFWSATTNHAISTNQPQQFQQHNISSHVSNSSIQAHAQPGTVRSPDGKPPHRCIAFGFGGTLATVSQAHENLFSLCTHSLHDMFRSSDDFGAREFVEVASDETFFLSNSENLMTDESLCSKCERLANNSSQTIGESEMWRILSLFLSRKKTFDSLRSFGEAAFKAEVASVLHVQNRADGSPSSLTSASVSERDASPAILMEIGTADINRKHYRCSRYCTHA